MIEGPAWAQQGLDQREGRYPLAVEAPVLSMVATLLPGLSTLTQFARYYGLYWAIAEWADRLQLDAVTCRRLVRRAEVLFAFVSQEGDEGRAVVPHGADALVRGVEAGKPLWELAEEGKGSYSPRAWGFWSQYGGPSDALGTVTTDAGALRNGRHPCPPAVRELFAPLLTTAMSTDSNEVPAEALATLRPLSLACRETPDLDALRELFTATRSGRHDPVEWTSADRIRRSGLRILVRSLVMTAEATSPTDALRRSVAYGPAMTEDVVLIDEAERASAWRGLLLRHRSVGAWRQFWAELVQHVKDNEVVTREQLHDWISDRLPGHSVAQAVAELPPTTDGAGNPVAAEDAVAEGLGPIHDDVAVLMLGARRRTDLNGATLIAFLGGKGTGRGTYLDPTWVARRVADYTDRPLRALGRVLVDDMLAQSRRVALRKITMKDDRLQMFSRLHERNGTYTARTAEGSGNVGLRVDQLAAIAEQLGLITSRSEGPVLTPVGSILLEVPG